MDEILATSATQKIRGTHSILGSKNMTGSGSLIEASSNPLASAGVLGITTWGGRGDTGGLRTSLSGVLQLEKWILA